MEPKGPSLWRRRGHSVRKFRGKMAPGSCLPSEFPAREIKEPVLENVDQKPEG